MKVSELMEYLSTQEPDAEVVRFDDAEGTPRAVSTWDASRGYATGLALEMLAKRDGPGRSYVLLS